MSIESHIEGRMLQTISGSLADALQKQLVPSSKYAPEQTGMIQRWKNKDYPIHSVHRPGTGRASRTMPIARAPQFQELRFKGTPTNEDQSVECWLPVLWTVIPDRLVKTGARRLFLLIFDQHGRCRQIYIAPSRRIAKRWALYFRESLQVEYRFKPIKPVEYITLTAVRNKDGQLVEPQEENTV